MAITLWVNADGTLSGNYTLGSTEYAESLTTLGINGPVSITAPGGGFGARNVFDLTAATSCRIDGLGLSGDLPQSAGRILLLCSNIESADTATLMRIAATSTANGLLQTRPFTPTGITTTFDWNNFSSSVFSNVTVPSQPVPYALEIIYDALNPTPADRLRTRAWQLGTTPGAFTGATGGSSAVAADPFTSFQIGDGDNNTRYQVAQLVVESDTSVDLSQYEDVNNYPGAASNQVLFDVDVNTMIAGNLKFGTNSQLRATFPAGAFSGDFGGGF